MPERLLHTQVWKNDTGFDRLYWIQCRGALSISVERKDAPTSRHVKGLPWGDESVKRKSAVCSTDAALLRSYRRTCRSLHEITMPIYRAMSLSQVIRKSPKSLVYYLLIGNARACWIVFVVVSKHEVRKNETALVLDNCIPTGRNSPRGWVIQRILTTAPTAFRQSRARVPHLAYIP